MSYRYFTLQRRNNEVLWIDHGVEPMEPERRSYLGLDTQLEELGCSLAQLEERYEALRWDATEAQLREVGEALAQWLEGDRLWLTRMRRGVGHFVLRIIDESSELTSLPWEILYAGEWLAKSKLIPVRLCGSSLRANRGLPTAQEDFHSDDALTVVNLGATPEALQQIDVHRLEYQLVRNCAAQIDFHFLCTGTLSELLQLPLQLRRLSECRDNWPPEIIQLSARGVIDQAGPAVLLEDPQLPRCSEKAYARSIANALPADCHPRLLILWAGYSANDQVMSPSLCAQLATMGFEYVLGWAMPIEDEPAIDFMVKFYTTLASHRDLYQALANTRLDTRQGDPSWHLTRLYASRGPVNRRTPEPRPHKRQHRRATLDIKHSSDYGLGLRRERGRVTQAITSGRHVLLHGPAGQGKTEVVRWLPSALSRWRFVHLDGAQLSPSHVVATLESLLQTLVKPTDAAGLIQLEHLRREHEQRSGHALEDAVRELLHSPLLREDPLIIVVDRLEEALRLRFDDDVLRFELAAPAQGTLRAIARGLRSSRPAGVIDSHLILVSSYGIAVESIDDQASWDRVCVSGFGYSEVWHQLRELELRKTCYEQLSKLAREREGLGLTEYLYRKSMANFSLLNWILRDHVFEAIVTRVEQLDARLSELTNRPMLSASKRRAEPAHPVLAPRLRERELLAYLDQCQAESPLIQRMSLLDSPIPELVVRSTINRTHSGEELDIEALVDLGLFERVPDLVKPDDDALRLNRVLQRLLSFYREHRGTGPVGYPEAWSANDPAWIDVLGELSLCWSHRCESGPLSRLHAAHSLVNWTFGPDTGQGDKQPNYTHFRDYSDERLSKTRIVRERVATFVDSALLYHCYRYPDTASAYADSIETLAGDLIMAGSPELATSWRQLAFWVANERGGEPPPSPPDPCGPERGAADSDEAGQLERRRGEAVRLALDFLNSTARSEKTRSDQRKLINTLGQFELVRLEIMVRYCTQRTGYEFAVSPTQEDTNEDP